MMDACNVFFCFLYLWSVSFITVCTLCVLTTVCELHHYDNFIDFAYFALVEFCCFGLTTKINQTSPLILINFWRLIDWKIICTEKLGLHSFQIIGWHTFRLIVFDEIHILNLSLSFIFVHIFASYGPGGDIYNNHIIANFLQSVPVNKFRKLVNNWQKYSQK